MKKRVNPQNTLMSIGSLKPDINPIAYAITTGEQLRSRLGSRSNHGIRHADPVPLFSNMTLQANGYAPYDHRAASEVYGYQYAQMKKKNKTNK